MVDERTVVKSGGSNIGLIFLAVAIVIAAVVGFIIYQTENANDNAVAGAAQAVGEAAQDVGDAAKRDGK